MFSFVFATSNQNCSRGQLLKYCAQEKERMEYSRSESIVPEGPRQAVQHHRVRQPHVFPEDKKHTFGGQ